MGIEVRESPYYKQQAEQLAVLLCSHDLIERHCSKAGYDFVLAIELASFFTKFLKEEAYDVEFEQLELKSFFIEHVANYLNLTDSFFACDPSLTLQKLILHLTKKCPNGLWKQRLESLHTDLQYAVESVTGISDKSLEAANFIDDTVVVLTYKDVLPLLYRRVKNAQPFDIANVCDELLYIKSARADDLEVLDNLKQELEELKQRLKTV